MTGDRLAGQVALITGAGSGIGQATAVLFARHGARVLAADLDEDAAQHTATAITEDGGRAVAWRVDISRSEEALAMVERALSTFGEVGILVNNAGFGVAGDLLSTTDADLDRTIAVNVKGIFSCCRAALPHMLARGRGIIVNVASAAAIAAVPNRAAYIASKGAVIALTRSIAVDYMHRGIRCNCVAPGTTDTPWIDRMVSRYHDASAARRLMVERQPIGRLARAEEIAHAILYLASPEADFAHGTCLVIDGGYTAG